MRLEKSKRGKIIWVKKTKFSKTEACLFIYHELIFKKRVSKQYLEDILETDCRATIHNYIAELKAYLHEFDFYLDYSMEIKYDTPEHEYVLIMEKKK